MIGPLNDIIAENLGQRGRRAEELAWQADTMADSCNIGCPDDTSTCGVDAAKASMLMHYISGKINNKIHKYLQSKSHQRGQLCIGLQLATPK